DVLHQLPERLEKRFFVPMTPQQMEHHEENREIVGRLVAKWRRFRFLSEADQRRLLVALQNMRMACDSTYLLDQRTDHGAKADELATLVVNIDLPWNPAVLEQRIGRVHRLGQTRPVQVVNFVAKGTIEEGMLSVLGFKRSLFAGVLDGGDREVFLGGSRLKRFMES